MAASTPLMATTELRFGLPGHWGRTKRRPGLGSLRRRLYQAPPPPTPHKHSLFCTSFNRAPYNSLQLITSPSKDLLYLLSPPHFTSLQLLKAPCTSLPLHHHQGFRFQPSKRSPGWWPREGQEGAAPWLHKRGLGEATSQLNSVPFIGKRTMEEGEQGLGKGDVMADCRKVWDCSVQLTLKSLGDCDIIFT